MSNLALQPLAQATWETIYMVFCSSLIGIGFGLLFGVLLFATKQGQFWDNKVVNNILGFITNTTRSIPFIILLVALIPLTRLLMGTTIGTNAAIVPLSIAAIPFYARIVESALSEVSLGLIEAAHAMGATPLQIIIKVLIPESLSSLIKGGTLTVIGLIGYSAMAGAVGGGGLGELAINYGYQRFNTIVMIETVVILVIVVQIIQSLGDYFAKSKSLKPLFFLTLFLLVASITQWTYALMSTKQQVLKVGIMSGQQETIMEVAKKVAKQKYNLSIQLVTFDDYVQPNEALNHGEIDANIFQHTPYLDAQVQAHGYQISAIGKTFVYPMGFYSQKIKNIQNLPDNAIVAVPNDPSNEGRALLILAKANLITLNPKAGLFATTKDIIANPKHLQFKALQNAQLARVLPDATLVALTNDFVGPVGFTVNQAILKETADSPYANVIAVQTKNLKIFKFKELVKVMHSKAVIDITKRTYPNGGAIVA